MIPDLSLESPISLLIAFAIVATIFFVRSGVILIAAFAFIRHSAFALQRRVYRIAIPQGQIRSELGTAVCVLLLDAAIFVILKATGALNTGAVGGMAVAVTFASLFVWFEIWFYATHRLLHTRALYFIHRQHHKAKVTDPLTSLSFSLVERLILIVGAIGPAAVVSQFTPVSIVGLSVYFLTNYALNVLGHSNVEVFPASFPKSWLGRMFISPTYHAMHHARYKGHYGLFTPMLDRWLNTTFDDYPDVHARAASNDGLTRLAERSRPDNI